MCELTADYVVSIKRIPDCIIVFTSMEQGLHNHKRMHTHTHTHAHTLHYRPENTTRME